MTMIIAYSVKRHVDASNDLCDSVLYTRAFRQFRNNNNGMNNSEMAYLISMNNSADRPYAILGINILYSLDPDG